MWELRITAFQFSWEKPLDFWDRMEPENLLLSTFSLRPILKLMVLSSCLELKSIEVLWKYLIKLVCARNLILFMKISLLLNIFDFSANSKDSLDHNSNK